MRGYYKASDPLPVDSEGYLPTGDAGSLSPAGYLSYAGRSDRMIKTAGVNVSPLEIEERLLSWGRLSAAAVVGVPHPTLSTAVVLAAVRRLDDWVDEEDIRLALRERLASYKVPRAVIFLEPDELPRTVSNKVDARALRSLVARRLEATVADAAWSALLADDVSGQPGSAAPPRRPGRPGRSP